MIVDIISIVVGICSIVLSIYAIEFAKRESARSEKNHEATEELLNKIEKIALSNQRDIGYTNNDLKNI